MYCVFYGFKQGMDHVPSDKTRCWARFLAKQNVIKQGSIKHITLNKQGMEHVSYDKTMCWARALAKTKFWV